MSKLVMLLVCGVVSFIMFMACLINGVRWAIGVFAHRDCANTVRAFKKSGFALLGILLFMGIFVITTQLLASTPTIKDSNGKIVEGSIASLTSVKLNGHKEWITIRGNDKKHLFCCSLQVDREAHRWQQHDMSLANWRSILLL